MNRCAYMAVVAGLACAVGSVNGEVNTRVDMLVSTDGVNFSSHVNLVPNGGTQTVEVLVRMTYIGSSTDVAGFASAVFQPTVSNFGSSDTALAYANGGAGSNQSTPPGYVADAPGQYGRISPYARTALTTSTAIFNHIHNNPLGDGVRYLRVAQRQVTSWIGGTGNTSGGSGVNVAQLANVGRTSLDPAFDFGTTANVFRFGLQIDTSTGEAIRIVDAPLDGFGNRNAATGEREVYWWSNAGMNGNSGDLRGTAIVVQAHIGIPAPATLMLIGALPLVMRRRRG